MLAAIILSRTLSTSDFASYSYFHLTASMIATYASMGLGVTASRYFAEIGSTHASETFPLGVLWAMSICLSVLAFVCVVLAPASLISPGVGGSKWLLATGVLVFVLAIVPAGAILGLEKYKQAALISLAVGILIIVGAFLAAKRADPNIAIAYIISATLLQAFGESFIIVRSVGWKRTLAGLDYPSRAIGKVLNFAAPMLLVSILSASGTWMLGRLILRQPAGQQAFAQYFIGLQWFSLALIIPGMVNRVLLPRMVRSFAGGIRVRRALVSYGAVCSMLASIMTAGIGMFFSGDIIALYGTKYAGDKWLVGAYLMAATLSSPVITLGNAIVSADGQRAWLFVTIIWMVVLLLIGVSFPNSGGLVGASALGGAALVQTILAFMLARSRKLL